MGKKDIIFVVIVVGVITLLSLGSTERKTVATPNDETHSTVTSRKACLSCHDADGIRPRPVGHTQADQCFLCHTQPESWQGAKP